MYVLLHLADMSLIFPDSFRTNLRLRLEFINVELVIHGGALERVDSVNNLGHLFICLGHVIVDLGFCVVHISLITLEYLADLLTERLILALVNIELAHLILHIENRNV